MDCQLNQNPSTLMEVLTLRPSSLGVFFSSILCRNSSSSAKRSRQSKVIFRKPKPTPLLTQPKPKTKLEALNKVVVELEKSFDNGIRFDPDIFASLLETCFQLQAFTLCSRIHRLIPEKLLKRNVGLSSKMLRLYAADGQLEVAHQLFDKMFERNVSPFPWNSLISGYSEQGLYNDALALYFQMVEEGVEPDRFTFPRVLKACSGIGSIHAGEEVHRHIVRTGFFRDEFVQNALIDMYAKCGDIVKARAVFDKMTSHDNVSWNSMITGYIHHGLLTEALNVFRESLSFGYEPDSVAISAILTGMPSLKLGAQVHGWVIRRGIVWELSVANCLIFWYSKMGKIVNVRTLFDKMPEKDVVSWNSIISAHYKHTKALDYFEMMEDNNVIPDSITFVSLLSVCAQMGLVKKGEELFLKMKQRYKLEPIMEHYACMVNLYGRAGLINEAYKVITKEMEFDAGPTVWGALLYACSVHGNVEIGEVSGMKLFELEPDNEHNFELLMKIYGEAGRLEDVERVKRMMEERGLC
ncbi:pentatricopeptide repeat-containing protein At4g25270, chloroplastic [Impatiens glandulifera]|uniref:pentatricopeptide repeat-containing protein At4g25270, chloroplastic n=1 Tax=Impatiens glandulifera TaxID=253017 RepID=UPI001FB19BBB|nr:pentatricopeptide repeat-containing protein At4g25270, chloroplastic [Impatiens glandulifera]